VKVAEVAAEGSRVTTGDVVLELDMDRYADRLKQRKRQHQNRELQLDKLVAQQAQALAAGETQVTEKRLSLATAREKLGILLAGPRGEAVRAQELMLEAGVAVEADRTRKLEDEAKLRAQGFTSEIAYLDAVGELEKARQRREAAAAELERLEGGPRPEDRRRLTAEEAKIALETSLVEEEHDARVEVQGLQHQEKQLEVQSSEGKLVREEKRLGLGIVRAPASGVVLHSLGGTVGNAVESGTQMWSAQEALRVVDLDSFQVLAEVGERDVDHVKVGAAATITFPALPGASVPATVLRLGKFAVPEFPGETEGRKVFQVTLVLDEVPEGTRPNLTAEVEIHRGEAVEGWRVVPEAVGGEGQATHVRLPGGREVPVEVLARDGAWVYLAGEPPAERLAL
jgi:multidrug resistance efflux pump